MALAGTGIRIGDVTQFDASIRFPRGMASDGTTCILFDANKGHTLNVSTGAATRIGDVANFDVSERALRSATYHNNQFIFYGHSGKRIYSYNESTGVATALSPVLITPTGITSTPDLWGLTSLNGIVWALDRTEDILVTVNLSTGALTRIGNATDYGLTGSPNIQAFTAYKGQLIAASNGLDELVRFNATTGVATGIVSGTDLPDGSPEALVEHDGNLLMAGSGADALFRLYDVLWNETIADIEVDEGADATLDLRTVSQDATSFEFAPSNTSRSWLTLSGNDLNITTAPDVDSDTDYEAVVRAIRGSVHPDKTLTVRVIDTTPPPVIVTAPLAPSNLRVTNTDATSIDIEWNPESDGGSPITDHEVSVEEGTTPGNTWNSTGSTNTTHSISNLKKGTQYTIQVRAVNNEGESPASNVVRPTTDTTVPSVLRNLRITPGTGSQAETASVAFDAPSDTGGLTIDRYESRHAEGTSIPPNTPWDDRGASRNFTLSNLEKGTEHAIEVRAVNAEGAGNPTDTTFTTEATEPDAPTGLSADTIGITNVEISWQNGKDGGSEITGHQSRIQEGNTAGGTWENTDSIDTSHILSNLQPSTEYTVEVRTLNAEGESQPSNALTFTTQVYVPIPPIWQSGAALAHTINAGESTTIDIGALVPNADTVEEIFGLQFHWMDYNEATKILTLTDAPIVRDDTEIRIRYEAENQNGVEPADFVITLKASVLASLHNMLFFEEPINYEPERVTRQGTSTVVTQLTDNDKTTFSTHTDFAIDISDSTGNPTAFDYVFIIAKGQNIRVSITPTGGVGSGFANRFVSETLKNIGGGEVSKVVNDLIYDLYPLPSRVTATNVRLRIHGTNIEVYAVMLLKLGWELDANSKFIDMQFDRVDRTGNLTELPDGYIERDQVLGAEGFKWEGQFSVIVKGSDVDEWMDWTEANINCAFAREFSRHPGDTFLAFFPSFETPNGYLGLVKSVGETIQFGVSEQ